MSKGLAVVSEFLALGALLATSAHAQPAVATEPRAVAATASAPGPTASDRQPALASAHALVVDEHTGAVLLTKEAQAPVPMASLTKLLTVMVVLDRHQDLTEVLDIAPLDLDTLKHTHSGVPVGARLTRAQLVEIALMASDNHAASSLARHYPGGLPGFLAAVQAKAKALGLRSTHVVEPTGLSPDNQSSAADVALVLAAATRYPQIAEATTQARATWGAAPREHEVRNTNALVGRPGWDILMSKTGFTNEAGRCLAMRLRVAGRTVLVVLLDAQAATARTLDAVNIQRWLEGQVALVSLPAEFGTPKGHARVIAHRPHVV